MDMQATVSQLAVLFILLALGYAGYKIKALTSETGRVLTKLILNITLPCTILFSVIGGQLQIAGAETFLFLLMVILIYVIYFIIAEPTARFLVKGKDARGLYKFMLVFSNVAFMGLPVSIAIFGSEAVFYVAIFNIPFWIASLSYGVMMISGKKGAFHPKAFLNPSLLASLLVIPIALSGFRAPDIVLEAVRLTGNITTPASMIIIGVTLAQTPIRDVFTQWRLYPLVFIKLVIIPLVVWLIFRSFIQSDLVLGVLVILSGMPTAAIAAMFAIEYKNNENTASSGVFLTTLLSGVTIPLIVFFLLV